MSLDVSLSIPYTETPLLEGAILQTLGYADVFDYPLAVSEIHRYLTAQSATMEEVTGALHEMMDSGLVACDSGFFSLPGRDSILAIRHRRSEIAAGLWRKATRYGRIIASLPFIRMVAITGSLCMNNTERGTDIDLMLVAAPHRLWTCRALVLLLGRLTRLEGATLCPNYIITTDALEFQEHSLYVAHEVAQMIPLSGMDVYREIRRLNAWTDEYLPNAQVAPRSFVTGKRPSRWQSWLEAALAMFPIAWFEAWEMNRKIRKLSREQSGSGEAYFSVDVCKGHAGRHKQHTEALLRERLQALISV